MTMSVNRIRHAAVIAFMLGGAAMSVRVTFAAAGPTLAPPVKLFTGRYGFGGRLTMAN
jgi:hypothetical protein